jgi:RNA polymerase sigma-70 factor (ECF subfamily)
MGTRGCCGRPSAEECRCHTDAAAIAEAIGAFVGRRVRWPEDAEDVTQEALLRLYRSAERLKDERALEGWMYQIARSAIIDHRRRAAARPEAADPDGLEALAEEPDEEPRPEEELATCLAPLLARVPDSYRQALELTDLAGMSQPQAAALLGLSVSGMKSRVQRGRRLLRAEVGRCCRVELDARGALADASVRDETGLC